MVGTAKMPEGASEAAWQLATTFGRIEALRRMLDQGARLGAADRRLMWLLSDGEPRTLREIAEALGLEQSTVNRQANVALGEGLLRRYREPGRSAWLITATDEGLDRFRHDLELNLGAYETALAALPEDEAAAFPALLSRFVQEYQAVVGPDLA